jgi:6-pyruvoyltetrahydropterin/6-carboxytetrahydropterin synthase
MNVTICKEMRMAMAHQLPYHGGKCRQLHGHTYVVRVYVTGPVQEVHPDNPQSGMVADFGVIKDFLSQVEALMDHQFVNDTLDEYPTAERIALKIARMAETDLNPHLPDGAKTTRIRVYEEYVTPQAFAEVEL